MVDILDKKSLFFMSRTLRLIENVLLKNLSEIEKYSEGSWWGNNTIWKTILDINQIILYADKQGKIQNNIQRKVITIGDMVIAGEGKGP